MFTNRAMVCSDMPSMFIPSFDTKRANFFSLLAGHSMFVQCNVSVPLEALVTTSVGSPHTGQRSGISRLPTLCSTFITFGIILLALITEISVPLSPMPNRWHSLMLQREARFTVVPSNSTGSNTATGDIVDAAHDHSIWSNFVTTLSSCHLKA